VVVHHARRLHEGVADRGSHELESAAQQLLAHRFARGDRLAVARAAHRLAADEAPDELVERSEFPLHLEEGARVADDRLDLRAIAHDAFVLQERPLLRRRVARDLLRVEAIERAPVAFALAQDREPAQSGLRALEIEHLEELAVVVLGPAPLFVVVREELLVRCGPLATRRFHRAILHR
jgi:hypothetical protein